MVSLFGCAARRDASVAQVDHFHNLVAVERIADANSPRFAIVVIPGRSNIAADIQKKVPEPAFTK